MNDVRNFTVDARTSEPEQDSYGNWSYFVKLEGVEQNALIRHSRNREPYGPGDTIEGYFLEEKTSVAGKPYYKLTRPQQPRGGGGGGGARNPAERASIERQVAAKCATDLLVGFMGTGWKPESTAKLADQHKALAKEIAQEIAAA